MVAYKQDPLTNTQIGVDNAGNVMAAYYAGDGMGLYVSEYVPGSNTWGPGRYLGDPMSSSSFDFERAPSGRAIATWVEYPFDRPTLHVARYVPGVGWGETHRLLADKPLSPQAAIRDDGVAQVVYTRTDASGQRQVVIRTAASDDVGFGDEQLVYDSADAGPVDFAATGAERTLLFHRPGDDTVHALRYVGGTWHGPTALSASSWAYGTARVVMDAAGAARAFWADNSTIQHRYVAAGSSAWGAPESIALFEEPGTFGHTNGSAMNIQGEAVAVRSSSDDQVYVAYYRPAQGWSASQPIFAQDGYLTDVSVGLAPTGAAATTWEFAPSDGDSFDYMNYNLWGSVLR